MLSYLLLTSGRCPLLRYLGTRYTAILQRQLERVLSISRRKSIMSWFHINAL